MSDVIREAFDVKHPRSPGQNLVLREKLFDVFKEGWDAGAASVTRVGYYIPTVDCDDWGCKVDGYMVGFSVAAIKAAEKAYTTNNTNSEGQYYEITANYVMVVLTDEAVEKIKEGSPWGRDVAWFGRRDYFKQEV